jgi:hypothetical protein
MAIPGINFVAKLGQAAYLTCCGRRLRMAQARYFVVQHDGNWLIKFDDEEYGPYRTQSEAMLFAIDAAQKLGDQGDRKAEVCVMGENGHFRPEWTYGQGPYLPRA